MIKGQFLSLKAFSELVKIHAFYIENFYSLVGIFKPYSMRKIYKLTLLLAVLFESALFAQTSYIKVPSIQTTTTTTRAANGTTNHVTYRGVYIMRASELTTIGTNTAINAVGFFLNFGINPAVTGTMQIYLQNTSDVTYNKGINFTTAIAPMTSVFNNTMTIPVGTTTTALPVQV